MSIEFFNEDCIQGMKRYPDKYFDLAIVDPVYGDVTQGGYMKNLDSTTKLAKPRQYHLSLWNQSKTGKQYFDELFRVSKNQIIWGGIILLNIYLHLNAGSVGIRKKQEALLILSWHSLHLIVLRECLDLCGMACCKKI